MKLKRFSEEQIALRQAESGATIEEICRKKEISAPAFITGNGVYAGMA
jgi:putative transposase